MAAVMSALRDDSPFSHLAVRLDGPGGAPDGAGAGLADGAGAALAEGAPAAAAALLGAGPGAGEFATAKTSTNSATGLAAPMPRVRPTSRLACRDRTSRPGGPGAGEAAGGTGAT